MPSPEFHLEGWIPTRGLGFIVENRDFVKLTVATILAALTLSVFAIPLLAEGQPTSRVPRIGYLAWSYPPPSDPWREPFRERLRELGYVEGENIVVEYRWAEERSDHAADLAAELKYRRIARAFRSWFLAWRCEP